MRKANCRIGFNDGLLMAIGMPLLAFIVPIVFMNCRFSRAPFFTWDKFLATLVMTAFIWIGNRYIMIYSRKKYPHFDAVRKRIILQSSLMVVFTIVSNIALGRVFSPIFNADRTTSYSDVLIHSNSAALFSTIMVIAVYESIFFMNQLRQAVQEREKLKRETISAELQALKTQVNPHFLFNNLNTLASLIPEDPKVAVDFVQQLSKLYRHILEVKDEPVIALRDELDVMRAYAFLLHTRFGNNLDVSIQVPEEKLDKKVIPLSLQILMENAIKHNIVSSDRPLKVDVVASNGKLVVSNNLQKKNQVNESTGIGLDNIRSRYALYGNARVEVIDNGTSFTVSIPLLDV